MNKRLEAVTKEVIYEAIDHIAEVLDSNEVAIKDYEIIIEELLKELVKNKIGCIQEDIKDLEEQKINIDKNIELLKKTIDI